jgi:(3R)-3-hydroxyacyl-CoA dehydrogenase / 3a,7a,12a-trihydroxy-5b-cholest-24-enoyl-CoA hydratase / enoyl-CoA hydratase 2
MSNDLRFDDRVAIITGAGGGLGRSHALLLAGRGAKVVVNDLGGAHTGEGKSSSAADKVVAEIIAAGGQAVASYDSVENGELIVKTAIDTWGRIDILINNAGILRDVSFPKMSQQDWDLIYRVHVLGAFKTTYAAWPYMRDQGYGRIVMTASAAGIYGNFGQANYSMAKLGLVGFSNTLAIEGKKRNIVVNSIAPIAGSRMTETVLPQALLDALKPELVSPLVARLCHESNQDSGGLYEVGGGFFSKLRWERSTGKTFRLGRDVSIEDVDAAWPEVQSFKSATHPENIALSMQPIMDNVEAGPSKGGNQWIDVDAALGYQYPDFTTSYDERDLAIYALGVGAAEDPVDDKDLQLVYELHGRGMKALPSYGVIPAINTIFSLGKQGVQAPGLKFGLDRVLHGEQVTELLRPLPLAAKLTNKARITDIFDKGKNALVVTEIVSHDERGEPLIRNVLTTLVRGAGGWGGDRGPSADVNVPPDRAPDRVTEQAIPKNQALLYRLSGDWNPLHADPSFAKAFGFAKPILHGLCSFGFAARHVLAAFAPEGNPDFFRRIQVRFASTVFPGETLVTEMWKESDQKIIFRCKIKERTENAVVISNAAIELFSEIPRPKAKASAPASSTSAAAPATTSADIFRAIGGLLAGTPAIAEKVRTTFAFKLTGPESAWTIDLASGAGSVAEGAAAGAKCTLEMSDADFLAMATGAADAMKLFSTGKLKIAGDVMASQKLSFLKKLTPEMVAAETQRRTGGSAGAAASAAAAPAGADVAGPPSTAEVFAIIADHLQRNPDVAAKVGNVYQWKIVSPDSSWLLDLKNGGGSVKEGQGTADCTLEIAEADFIDMTSGKADAMKLFTTGKLKIAGNVMASQKLEFLRKLDPQRAAAVVAGLRGKAAPKGEAKAVAPAAASSSASSAPRAAAIFAALGKRLAEQPGLAAEVGAVVQFHLTDPASSWTVDLSGATPRVEAGQSPAAAVTLSLRDAELAALAAGTTLQQLYQRGQVRLDGDVSVARRFTLLKGLA